MAVHFPRLTQSVHEPDTIKVWDAKTGDVKFIRDHFSPETLYEEWSPDKKSIVSRSLYIDEAVQVWVWDAETGDLKVTFIGHCNGDSVVCVAWSPDDKKLSREDLITPCPYTARSLNKSSGTL